MGPVLETSRIRTASVLVPVLAPVEEVTANSGYTGPQATSSPISTGYPRPGAFLAPRTITRCKPGPHWAVRSAALLQALSFLLFLVAYASPYWEYSSDAVETIYSGLWTVCEYVSVGHKCGHFADHKMQGWFRMVQVSVTISFVLQFLALLFTIFYFFLVGAKAYRRKILITATVNAILAVVFLTFTILVYGIKQGYADPDTLSWAYYVAVTSGFFLVGATVCLGVELKSTHTTAPDKRPILQRSISLDTSMVHSMSDPQLRSPSVEMQGYARPRSESEVRMRVNSCSSLSPNIQDLPDTPGSDLNASGSFPYATFTT